MQFALHFKCFDIHVSRQSITYTHTHVRPLTCSCTYILWRRKKVCYTFSQTRIARQKFHIQIVVFVVYFTLYDLCIIRAQFIEKNQKSGRG